MFSKVEKVRGLIKLEAEARMKELDPSSHPKDFIEAFLFQIEQVKSLMLGIYFVVVYVIKKPLQIIKLCLIVVQHWLYS